MRIRGVLMPLGPKRLPAVLIFATALIGVPFICLREAKAFREMDTLLGSDQRFKTEYSHEYFSEEFHQKQILFRYDKKFISLDRFFQ